MEKTLFDKNGDATAYLTDDYQETIYLWDGEPVAYLLNSRLVYGFNGKHLGWFIDSIVYDYDGKRIGFTSVTCPVIPSKEPGRYKKKIKAEVQPKWKESTLPQLKYEVSEESFKDFLLEGSAYNPRIIED